MIRIYDKSEIENGDIFKRGASVRDVSGAVAEIISDVIKNGDGALFRLTEKFDRTRLSSLEVSRNGRNRNSYGSCAAPRTI